MIFVLIGETGSGKDFFKSLLLKENIGLEKTITYTTRPIRDGEIDEKDYYFVTKEKMKQMIENNDLLEYQTYDTIHGKWYYATHINSFQNNDVDHICILDYKGYLKVKKMYGDKVVGFMFHRDYNERKEAYLARGGLFEEFVRRCKDDKEKFNTADSDENLYHVINDTKRTQDILKMLKCLIRGERENAIRNNRLQKQ